ncbi:uncharacterized protein Tco025E_09046 [Trypanosoma conorhini]|uniref:Uncharacterized protein n=1 Tax=Trypanosoma conorhini TaxID=83891 RepID=A0A3R7M4H2_9TRYP|nr:uncharacterized protein Tco025E_09046 [Trypanosoma conorhini]RNE99269.1 hypothetical protein Tco025E_09046 [Trypanosoma conorhini]
MRRRSPSLRRRKLYKLEGKNQRQPAVGATQATPRTTARPRAEERATTPMTEQETAALFLAELAATTVTERAAAAAAAGEKEVKQTGARSRGKRMPLVRTATREGKRSSASTRTSGTAKPSALGQLEIPALPLEEGEEDAYVSTEVLRQTAAFLARLTPARSKQFWALRQVARGELSGRSAAKVKEMAPASDEGEEEEEEEDVDLTSSEGPGDRSLSGAASEGEVPSSSEEVEDSSLPLPPRTATATTAKKMGVGKCSKEMRNTKRRGGGALFSSNPDVWED